VSVYSPYNNSLTSPPLSELKVAPLSTTSFTRDCHEELIRARFKVVGINLCSLLYSYMYKHSKISFTLALVCFSVLSSFPDSNPFF